MKHPRMTRDEFTDYVDNKAGQLGVWELVELLDMSAIDLLKFVVDSVQFNLDTEEEFLTWVKEQLWMAWHQQIIERLWAKLESEVIIICD